MAHAGSIVLLLTGLFYVAVLCFIALVVCPIFPAVCTTIDRWAGVQPKPKCKWEFDRNEIGPMGTYGQWWWDVYKCGDKEQRVLVASPRG